MTGPIAVGVQTFLLVSAQASLTWSVDELRYPGALASWDSYASSINDRGFVAGEATHPDGIGRPRVWAPDGSSFGFTLPLGSRGGTAMAINEKNDVAGDFSPGSDQYHAFCTRSGAFIDMGLLEGFYRSSAATGINEDGVVCGWGRDFWAVDHAFVWNDGTFTDIHNWDAQYGKSDAYGLNDAGVVAGTGRIQNYDYALIWESGQVQRLPGLPTDFVMDCAFGVNRDSVATGISWTGDNWSAALWREGSCQNLGTLSGFSDMWAVAVNDLEQVTGRAIGSGKYDSPFLWSERQGLFDLRELAGGMPGWSQVRPFGMNNKGQVVGQGIFEYQPGKTRWTAFKLTPVDTAVASGTVTVLLGKAASGNVQSLAALDGDVLKICRFVVPNQNAAPVTVQLDGTLPFFPMNLWLSVTARSANAGAYALRLDFWDRDALAYDARDLSSGALGTSFALQECVAKGDLSRYVGPFGKVRSRIRVSTVGPAASAGWCAEFDQAVRHAVPEE